MIFPNGDAAAAPLRRRRCGSRRASSVRFSGSLGWYSVGRRVRAIARIAVPQPTMRPHSGLAFPVLDVEPRPAARQRARRSATRRPQGHRWPSAHFISACWFGARQRTSGRSTLAATRSIHHQPHARRRRGRATSIDNGRCSAPRTPPRSARRAQRSRRSSRRPAAWPAAASSRSSQFCVILRCRGPQGMRPTAEAGRGTLHRRGGFRR